MGLFKTKEEKAEKYYDKAEALYEKKEYEKMIPFYEKAAQLGHLGAMNNLGFSYYYGYGVEKNVETAADWYKKAAEKNHLLSICNLGDMYIKGIGVERDVKKGVDHITRAAKGGLPRAMYELGLMYLYGNPVEKSREKAVFYLKGAAEKGHKNALESLNLEFNEYFIVRSDNNKTYLETLPMTSVRNAYKAGHTDAGAKLLQYYDKWGWRTEFNEIFDELISFAATGDIYAFKAVIDFYVYKEDEEQQFLWLYYLLSNTNLEHTDKMCKRYFYGDRMAEKDTLMNKMRKLYEQLFNGKAYTVKFNSNIECSCCVLCTFFNKTTTNLECEVVEMEENFTPRNKCDYIRTAFACGMDRFEIIDL